MELLEGTYKISADMHKKEFTALDKAIKSAHKIVLFHHKGIDADAKGSMLAMYKGIKQKYNKDVHMGGKNDHYELSETDLVILLDVGDAFRINGSYSGNPVVGRIDHHPTSFKCDINIEDVSAGSTSELVTLFLKNFDYEINPLVAEMLFKGIISDTGRLQYSISDTTLLALSILKSLNVDYKDIYKRMYVKDNDDLKLRNYILNNYKVSKNGVVYLYLDRERSLDAEIDIDKAGNHLHELGNIKGSPIWVLITDIGKNKITLRLRSRTLPINKIAEKYGGGGHENAAAVRVHSKHQAKQILADLDKYLMDEKISGFIKEWNEIENIPYNTLTEQALDNALDEILSETFETHAHKRRMKIINKSIKYLPEDVLNKALPEMKDKSHYSKVKAIRYRIEQLPEDRLNKILNSPAMIQLEENLRKTKRMILGISGGAAGATTASAISSSAMTVASYAADYAVAQTLENGLGLAFSIVFGGIFSVGVAALGVLGFTTAGIITATKNKNRVKKAIPDIIDLLKNEHVLVESNISFDFDDISQELIDEMVIYGLTESRLPKDGSDPEFGIPEEEKYPLFNKAHVISAIKLFGHVEDKYEAQLAHAIISKMKKYNISFDMIGENNRLYKYLPKSELNEKIHWDTILTKPTQLNKNITVYHFSDVKDPNNKVYPFRYTVGNKLSGKYYASWWAENPYDGALYTWFICKTVCNDEKIDKNEIRDYIVNWFAPDNDTPAVYIRKSWWAKYKDKVNKFNIYRYTKTFKVKELGRGQEYAVAEWTYEDEVVANKVDTMKPIDFLDKTLFVVSDEKFKEVRDKYFKEIVEKGYKTIGDARNKRPWIYYDYNKVKQMTKEIVLEPAYINPKYQHILDSGSSLSPTGFKGFEKKVKDGVEIKFMDASKEVGHAKVCDDYYGDKLSFLHDLEVKKEFRDKGYGTKIMQYLIDKYNIKYLNADPKNEIAIKLYKKFGFEKTEKVRMDNNKILDRMERQNNLKENFKLFLEQHEVSEIDPDNMQLNESNVQIDKKYDGKTLEVDVEAKLNDKNQKVKLDDTEIEVKKKKGKLELDVEVETDIHAENNKNINYYNNKLPKDIEASRKAGIPNNLAEVIAEAVIELSEKQIGAFITFEKEDNLEKYRKNGEKINAPVSRDIFMTIFYPGTAVHDGAIIIKDGIIKYASVFYENISSSNFAEHYGARHRAAMGISKDTDAVVIVVSEETGRISFAVDGKLIVTKPNDVEKNIEKYILSQPLDESTRYKYKKLLNMPEEKRNKLIAEDELYANAWNRWKDTDKAASLAQDATIKANIHSQAAKFAEKDKETAPTKKERTKANERVSEHYAAKEKHLKKVFKYKNASNGNFSIESHPDNNKPGMNSATFTKKNTDNSNDSQISLHVKTDIIKDLNNGSDVIDGEQFVKKTSPKPGTSVNNQTIKDITGETLKMKAGKAKKITIDKLKRKKNN